MSLMMAANIIESDQSSEPPLPPPPPMQIMTLADLKALIVDGSDSYRVIRRYLCATGKGRRPKLPPVIPLSNELLAQLYFLKEELQSSYDELRNWLHKLVPGCESLTEGRIYQQIQTILASSVKLPRDEMISLLEEEHDFFQISPALSALGLDHKNIMDIDTYHLSAVSNICVQVIIDLEHFRSKKKLPSTFVFKWTQKLSLKAQQLPETLCKRNISKVIDRYKQLNKSKRDEEKKRLYLKELFCAQTEPISCVNGNDAIEIVLGQDSTVCQECKKAWAEVNKLSIKVKHLQYDSAIKSERISDLQQNVSEVNDALLVERNALQVKIDLLTKELSAAHSEIVKQEKEVEKLKSEIKNITATNLYRKNRSYKRKLVCQNEERKQLVKRVKLENNLNTINAQTLKKLKEQIKTEQTLKSKYKTELKEQKLMNSDLSSMLKFDHIEKEIKLRENVQSHRFSDDIRKTYYSLLGENGVSAENCSKVISTVAKKLFHTDLSTDELPCASTALNFSNEAHIVAKQHIVDELKSCEHFTYASDGTSRDKAHFLEQHLHLDNGKTLSLGFSEIASDDAETLLDKCVNVFDELCELHCIDDSDPSKKDDLLKDIIRKLKALLSDRAAVCKLFDSKMAQYKQQLLGGDDASIHFLFCNAHFLIALSTAVSEAISCVEKESDVTGEKLGRDALPVFAGWGKTNEESAAVRLIRLAADIVGPRCDEKSGARQEWLAFCSLKGIKPTFTSYRSNRFNSLFMNATAVLRHRQHMILFLTDYVSHSNLKLQSVLADLQDDRILTSISVISFFHVHFAEPYWKLMNSKKMYVDFPDYVKKMKSSLTDWTAVNFDPVNVTSVFEHEFTASDDDICVLKDDLLSESCDMSSFLKSLHIVVDKCQIALSRQLSDFLEGGVFGGELDQNVKDILKTCPLTNLAGERLFGDLDYCLSRRRNASLHLRSTNSMWKHNYTSNWLRKQSPTVAQNLLKKAIKYAPEWKQRFKDDKKMVQRKIKMKIEENKRLKEEKINKLNQKKLAAVDAVYKNNGGTIVSTKEELDVLYNGPKAVDRMKDQIRYRSLIRGEKILMTGNKETLYRRLLNHIESL